MTLLAQSIKADQIIGGNIRKARTALRMTQGELSAKVQLLDCDISRGTLAKIEAGIRHISVAEINAIKEVLGMRYEDFFMSD
ncbi:MAG: helix-turn-helix transcriptional regulator [Candidatus Limiplasma sp.]|nr:helix-turn-helix transcriptional regulator [Candidatus Limiplasma sp.]